MVAVSVVRLVTVSRQNESFIPVDCFDKTMCPSGIIFSFWRLTRQTTVSADPPVSADPRIVGTDILKRVSSCLNIVPCIFRQHPYFKNFETGLVRFQNTCEKHLSFSAIFFFFFFFHCGQISFIVRLLSRFMA